MITAKELIGMDVKKFKFANDGRGLFRRRLYLTIVVCCIFTVTMAYFATMANSRRALQVGNVESVRHTSFTPIPLPDLWGEGDDVAVWAIIEEDAPGAYAYAGEREPITFTRPANGPILVGFSWDELVFNRTMNDWRVHLGVDFAGDIGASVFAVADGVVQWVGMDEMMGRFIEIRHSDGFVSKYYNLQENVAVREGDVVSKGQVIGGIGNTAAFKAAEPPHLHFELFRDGILMNPLDVLP